MRTVALVGLCLLGSSCRERGSTLASASNAPASATSSAAPAPATSHSALASASASAEPSSPERAVRATPQVVLTDEQQLSLKKRFPAARVQSAVAVPTVHGTATMALVWEQEPAPETLCPPEGKWTAFDMQSCVGFKGALAGRADLVRFDGATLGETFSLSAFFGTADNPSGVDPAHRGPLVAYIPRDYRLVLYDFNGDGRASETLLHVGNGPYAMIRYLAAVGLFRDRLESPKTQQGRPVVDDLDAWLSLEKTGRGASQIYCGARCGNTAMRWVIQRNARGLVDEHAFWTCTPDDEASWKPGESNGACEPR